MPASSVQSLKRVVRRLIHALTKPPKIGLLRFIIRLCPRIHSEGFEIIDFAESGSELPSLGTRIGDAIRIIGERDPRRFARLRRDVDRFLIASVSGPEYIHPLRACMLSASFVQRASSEQLALTIVHEATHARLSAMGINYDYPIRERIERACVREEVDFAARLPCPQELVAEAAAKLDDPWWTEEREFERRLRQLEQLGRPAWYRRLYAVVWDPR